MHPTFVFPKKRSTASVALSPQCSLTEGAHGCFYLQAIPICFHILSRWEAHALHCAKGGGATVARRCHTTSSRRCQSYGSCRRGSDQSASMETCLYLIRQHIAAHAAQK